MVPRRLLSSVVFVSLLFISALAHAQDASVIGTVTDDTKAILPGATITATNTETGNVATAVADERGQYRFQRLAPGKYKLQADLPGFASAIIPSVELLVGQNATCRSR